MYCLYLHTAVEDSTFDLVAPLRRTAIGFLLFSAFYIAFELAFNTGQDTAVAAMLWRRPRWCFWYGVAMRLWLGHMRWRGLRLRFQAGWPRPIAPAGRCPC